eukprot:1160833-Pelagomonas_calceolata.AAC.2
MACCIACSLLRSIPLGAALPWPGGGLLCLMLEGNGKRNLCRHAGSHCSKRSLHQLKKRRRMAQRESHAFTSYRAACGVDSV